MAGLTQIQSIHLQSARPFFKSASGEHFAPRQITVFPPGPDENCASDRIDPLIQKFCTNPVHQRYYQLKLSGLRDAVVMDRPEISGSRKHDRVDSDSQILQVVQQSLRQGLTKG